MTDNISSPAIGPMFVSVCCDSAVNEADSGGDRPILECSFCERPCKIKRPTTTSPNELKPSQASWDAVVEQAVKAPQPGGEPLTEESMENATPAPQPNPSGIVIKGRNVYVDGVLVGELAPLSDESWYEQKFGAKPEGWALENLKNIRAAAEGKDTPDDQPEPSSDNQETS